MKKCKNLLTSLICIINLKIIIKMDKCYLRKHNSVDMNVINVKVGLQI
jgi:hypothetical protein